MGRNNKIIKIGIYVMIASMLLSTLVFTAAFFTE